MLSLANLYHLKCSQMMQNHLERLTRMIVELTVNFARVLNNRVLSLTEVFFVIYFELLMHYVHMTYAKNIISELKPVAAVITLRIRESPYSATP